MNTLAMNLVYFFIVLISTNNGLPAGPGYNFVDFLYDDYGENSIDDGSETIDISSLGPEAYGLPKEESGE